MPATDGPCFSNLVIPSYLSCEHTLFQPIKSPETGAYKPAASIKFATPSWKSSSQIHKHFFGKDKKQ